MAEPTAYKKVIGGGRLKFKGGGSLTKSSKSNKLVGTGSEKAHGLEKSKAFKREHGQGEDTTIRSAAAAASSEGAAATPASAFASGTPTSVSAVIAPPVVLSGATARSSWALHKTELHEIDANAAMLRESDRAIEKMDQTSKKEIVAAEKRAIELQVANMVQGKLAPGVVFSVPSAANLNREYLFRKEAQLSNATARLNERSNKKADRYCK